jgi:hypothetical protein
VAIEKSSFTRRSSCLGPQTPGKREQRDCPFSLSLRFNSSPFSRKEEEDTLSRNQESLTPERNQLYSFLLSSCYHRHEFNTHTTTYNNTPINTTINTLHMGRIISMGQ